MRPNKVKRALMNSEVQIGTWITVLGTPQIAQMMGTAGFDFMYIDMEHSILSIETVGDLCCSALAAGLVPIVRPSGKDPHLLSRPLDGAVIGRADLSTDLGLPGQTDHPEIVRRVEMMIAACRRHGKIPGLLVQDIASAKEWIAKGILLVPYANEVSLLVNAGARAVREIRNFAKEGR